MLNRKQLLFLGTYTHREFDSIFNQHQFLVTSCKTLRKALSAIKKSTPDVIVAEFVYAPTYGSQLSNFESLFAAAQTFSPDATIVALVHKEDLQHLEKVNANIDNCKVFTLPLNLVELDSYFESLKIQKNN